MSDPNPSAEIPVSPGRHCAMDLGGFNPCDARELEPLLAFLARREASSARLDFLRGSLLPDGRLDLCKQRIGAAGAEAVAAALRGHPQVRHLLLGANGLGDRGAAAVGQLVQSGTLETVYLGCN